MDKEIYRVLFIYRAAIPSIIGMHRLFEQLERTGKIEYRFLQEMRISNADLDWADAIVLGRFDSWYEYHLAKQFYQAGDYTIYYIDDDMPEIPKDIKSAIYYARKDIKENILRSISLSDAILSPALPLLEKYAGKGKMRIPFQCAAVRPTEYISRGPERPIKIGFAGSLDRVDDIECMLKDALKRIKERYGKRVQFEFFGAVPAFATEVEAKAIPFIADYDLYRETLNSLEWDIGLAPIPDTPFHACKNYNKFVEYASSAIAGIYSDCEPYTRIPNREGFGRFCRNTPRAWYEAIYEEIDDAKTREAHRRAASEIAHRDYSLQKVSDDLFENCLPAFREGRNAQRTKRHQIPLLPMKVANIWFRGTGYIRQNGKNAPKAIANKLLDKARGRSA